MDILQDGVVPSLSTTAGAYASLRALCVKCHNHSQPLFDQFDGLRMDWEDRWGDEPIDNVFPRDRADYVPYLVPSYADFVAEEMSIYQTLPTSSHLLTMAPTVALAMNGVVDSKYIFSKLLAILGLKEIWEQIVDMFENYANKLWKAFWEAIKKKKWKDAVKYFIELLKKLMSERWQKVLAERIGRKKFAALMGKMAGKIVPGIGWAILAGQFVWALAEQYNKYMNPSVATRLDLNYG